jgi:hypothetical protein
MNILEKIKGVEGWLTEAETEALFRLASRVRGDGVIVEIGSWKGKSTICLAEGARAGSIDRPVKIYAVDPHFGAPEQREKYGGRVDTFAEFLLNIEQSGNRDVVVPLKKTSAEASGLVNEPIELLFIDGAHEYEMVLKDFRIWSPRLLANGMIAFHDSKKRGPRRVIVGCIIFSQGYRMVELTDSLTIAVKGRKSPLTMIAEVWMFLRHHYFRSRSCRGRSLCLGEIRR